MTKKKLEISNRNLYFIDCANCSYYSHIDYRLNNCPKCRVSLNERRTLY